jgi:hypothetical protein
MDSTKQDVFFANFFNKGPTITIPVMVAKEDVVAFGFMGDVAVKAYTISIMDWNGIFKGAEK